MRKTKIVCTLGPATDSPEVMRGLMLAGMNVARLNMSHQEHETHHRRAALVKSVREELGLPVALLVDTKGPEIRLGTFETDKVELKAQDLFTLTTEECVGDSRRAYINYAQLPQDVSRGDRILIDDGLIELKVEHLNETEIECRVISGGTVSARKGVNVPDVHLSMPFMNDRDRADIRFAVEEGADFIAASFVRCADDVLQVRAELEKNNDHEIRIISKIENAEGVANLEEILKVSDGIMVARGDMGVEIAMEELPSIQKRMIRMGYMAGLQVITATQMLESMIKNPRPTRAEVTDVANAIYDGTSAIMLSGETAVGAYPVETVRTMARIAERTERDIDYKKRFSERGVRPEDATVTNAISHATVTTAHDMGAAAILAITKSGMTARTISKFRPECPIICCTTSETARRQMNLSWGVLPIMGQEQDDMDTLFDHAVDCAVRAGLLKNGDLAVITAGSPLGVSGTTNLLKVHLVGNILVQGTGVTTRSVCGNLCVAETLQEAKKRFCSGDILVVPATDNRFLPLIREAAGVVTEADGMNSHAAVVGMALDKPVLVGAKNATKLLKNGTTVTLDAESGAVLCKK